MLDEAGKHHIVISHDERCARNLPQQGSNFVEVAHVGEDLKRNLVRAELVLGLCVTTHEENLFLIFKFFVGLGDDALSQVF